MDIHQEVIKFLSVNGEVDKSAVRIEGISDDEVHNVLKHLAMTGKLNQINGKVRLCG